MQVLLNKSYEQTTVFLKSLFLSTKIDWMILLDPGHRKSEAFQFVKLTFLNLCKHSETVVNFQNPKVFAL